MQGQDFLSLAKETKTPRWLYRKSDSDTCEMRNTIHHHTLFIQMFNNKLTFTLTSCAVWLAYLCEVLCCIYSAKHWQYKCCCFSCSRLRLSYHVVGSEIWTKQSNYFREVVSAWDQWSNLVNLIFPTFLRTHIDFAGFKISSKTPFDFSWKTSNMPPPPPKKKKNAGAHTV